MVGSLESDLTYVKIVPDYDVEISIGFFNAEIFFGTQRNFFFGLQTKKNFFIPAIAKRNFCIVVGDIFYIAGVTFQGTNNIL